MVLLSELRMRWSLMRMHHAMKQSGASASLTWGEALKKFSPALHVEVLDALNYATMSSAILIDRNYLHRGIISVILLAAKGLSALGFNAFEQGFCKYSSAISNLKARNYSVARQEWWDYWLPDSVCQKAEQSDFTSPHIGGSAKADDAAALQTIRAVNMEGAAENEREEELWATAQAPNPTCADWHNDGRVKKRKLILDRGILTFQSSNDCNDNWAFRAVSDLEQVALTYVEKEAVQADKLHCFSVETLPKKFLFCTHSEIVREEWVKAINAQRKVLGAGSKEVAALDNFAELQAEADKDKTVKDKNSDEEQGLADAQKAALSDPGSVLEVENLEGSQLKQRATQCFQRAISHLQADTWRDQQQAEVYLNASLELMQSYRDKLLLADYKTYGYKALASKRSGHGHAHAHHAHSAGYHHASHLTTAGHTGAGGGGGGAGLLIGAGIVGTVALATSR